jgi:hypothetical protein
MEFVPLRVGKFSAFRRDRQPKTKITGIGTTSCNVFDKLNILFFFFKC